MSLFSGMQVVINLFSHDAAYLNSSTVFIKHFEHSFYVSILYVGAIASKINVTLKGVRLSKKLTS